MSTVIIVLVLVVVCIYAGYSYIHKLRHGGDCCGEHETAEKKVRVEDRDKTHYPYSATLRIDGMTCGNCARRVENALNRLPGVWATVELGDKTATLRLKQPADGDALRQAVREAGYTVLEVVEG